jgi:SAM-dependent methyltransferase
MRGHRSHADSDVGAIFARLEAEVLARPSPASDDGDGWSSLRQDAERRWPVTAERSFAHRPGFGGQVRGYLLTPVKVVLRKAMRWYVEPFAVDQRSFNGVALNLLDELHEASRRGTNELREALATHESELKLLPELLDRVTRLERVSSSRPPVQLARADTPEPSVDYFSFEARMRGSTAEIRARQAPYVKDFAASEPVLDVGSGRGEFLALLREAGIAATGVDADPDMVAFSKGDGLDVACSDALEHMAGLEEGSLGGVFASQFVEHLSPQRLLWFLALAASRLRPGGLLIAETINPLSLFALRHFYADLSHAQPLVPETLEFLARQSGFEETEIRMMNELPESARLRKVELPPDPAFDAARRALDEQVERLNDVLFGAQDYALVARR